MGVHNYDQRSGGAFPLEVDVRLRGSGKDLVCD